MSSGQPSEKVTTADIAEGTTAARASQGERYSREDRENDFIGLGEVVVEKLVHFRELLFAGRNRFELCAKLQTGIILVVRDTTRMFREFEEWIDSKIVDTRELESLSTSQAAIFDQFIAARAILRAASTGLRQRTEQLEDRKQPEVFQETVNAIDTVVLELLKAISLALKGKQEHTYKESFYPWARAVRKQLKKSQPEGKQTAGSQGDLEKLLGDLPADYTACFAKLVSVTHAYRGQVATALQPRLDKHLKSLPCDSYDEKRELASWLNGQLRELGLAIRCPRTGKPAILVADLQGDGTENSRFRMDVRGDDGRKIRTLTSRELPKIELMEDVVREEPFAKRLGTPARKKPDRSK